QENRQVFFQLKNILSCLSAITEGTEYTVRNAGLSLSDAAQGVQSASNDMLSIIHDFEIELLSTLGYWDKANVLSQKFDTHSFIESLIERKLKSRNLFAK